MISSDPFHAVELCIDLLTGSQFREQDVWICWLDSSFGSAEKCLLPSHGMEREILGINVRVVVQFLRIFFTWTSVIVSRALNVES